MSGTATVGQRAQPEGSPEPRSLQGRYISPNEKCGGIAGGPAVRGVRSRSGTGRGGKIRSTGFDSTTTTGFASFGKQQLFLLETTLFSPFCRRISVLFSLNKSVFFVFFDKNSTKRPNCLVVRFVGNTMLRFGAKTRKKCENEQKNEFFSKNRKTRYFLCFVEEKRGTF